MTKPVLRGSLRRSCFSVLVILTVPLLALLVGVVAYFGSAILLDRIALVSSVAVLGCFATAYFLLAGAARLLGTLKARRSAVIACSIGTVLVATAVVFTAYMPVNYGFERAPAPAGTSYWDLASGSHIAYMHAEAQGRPRNEAVVFLHGGPGTPGEGFPPGTAALVSAGFDVYVYDQVGAGRSNRLDDVNGYTVARQVEDLEMIRSRIGVDTMTLVGRSWGASLAAQYIAAHPSHVARVVFVSPGVIWPLAYAESVSDPWSTLPKPTKVRFDALFESPRVLLMSLLLSVNPNAAHSLVGDKEADALLHAGAVIGQDAGMCPGRTAREPHSNSQGFYVNQLTNKDFAAIDDPRPVLRSVKLPVLIIRGECDFIVSAVAAEYARVFSGAQLVAIPHAGHAVWTQAPPAYLDALLTFLIDQKPAGSKLEP